MIAGPRGKSEFPSGARGGRAAARARNSCLRAHPPKREVSAQPWEGAPASSTSPLPSIASACGSSPAAPCTQRRRSAASDIPLPTSDFAHSSRSLKLAALSVLHQIAQLRDPRGQLTCRAHRANSRILSFITKEERRADRLNRAIEDARWSRAIASLLLPHQGEVAANRGGRPEGALAFPTSSTSCDAHVLDSGPIAPSSLPLPSTSPRGEVPAQPGVGARCLSTGSRLSTSRRFGRASIAPVARPRVSPIPHSALPTPHFLPLLKLMNARDPRTGLPTERAGRAASRLLHLLSAQDIPRDARRLAIIRRRARPPAPAYVPVFPRPRALRVRQTRAVRVRPSSTSPKGEVLPEAGVGALVLSTSSLPCKSEPFRFAHTAHFAPPHSSSIPHSALRIPSASSIQNPKSAFQNPHPPSLAHFLCALHNSPQAHHFCLSRFPRPPPAPNAGPFNHLSDRCADALLSERSSLQPVQNSLTGEPLLLALARGMRSRTDLMRTPSSEANFMFAKLPSPKRLPPAASV